MESSKTNLFKNTFIYTFGNLFSRGLSFILLPFYSYFFSASEFGVYSVIISAMTIISTFLNLGLQGIFVKEIAETNNYETRKKIFTSVFQIVLFLHLFFLLIVSITSDELSYLITSSPNYNFQIVLAFLSILFYNVSYFSSSFYIALENSSFLVKITSIAALVNFISNIILIGFIKTGINGIFYSQILSSILLIFLSSESIRQNFYFSFESKIISLLIKSSLPLLASGIFGIMVELIDRIFILKILGEYEAGIYSFGYRIALVYNLFILSFKTSWIPHIMKQKDRLEEELKNHLGRVFTKIIFFSAFITLSVVFFVDELFDIKIFGVSIFNESYRESIIVVLPVMLGYLFNLLMVFYSFAPYFKNKTIHFLYSDLIAFTLNILFNILLIKRFGIIGAALATLIAFMGGAFYLFNYSKRVIVANYELKKIIIIIFSSFIIYLIGKLSNNLFSEILWICLFLMVGMKTKIIPDNKLSFKIF